MVILAVVLQGIMCIDGFETQRSQWRPNKRHILGNRTYEKVKGHDRVRHLFVVQVHCSTKDEDIEQMVRESGVEVVFVSKISNTESRMKSYRLDMRLDVIEKVIDPEWIQISKKPKYTLMDNKTQQKKHLGFYLIILLGVMRINFYTSIK